MIIKYLCPRCNAYCELGDDIPEDQLLCPQCGGEVQKSKARYVSNINVPGQNNPTDSPNQRLILLSYLFAIIVPFVGFILGLYLLFKKDEIMSGVFCMIASFVSVGLWSLVFF